MEFLVNVVEFIAISAGIREIDLGGAMAVDTPAHAQFRKLLHFIHFLDRTMAGLALYFARADMLCVAEENMIGQIVDLDPLHRLGGMCIFSGFGIVAGVTV